MPIFSRGKKTKIKEGDRIVYSEYGCVYFLREIRGKRKRLFFANEEGEGKDDKKIISSSLPSGSFDNLAILIAETIGCDYELEKEGDPKTGNLRTFKFV